MKKGNKQEDAINPTTDNKEEQENMMYTVMNRGLRPNSFARPELMINRMMRDMCMPPRPHHRPPMGFPVDVRKAENAYVLTAELPGVKLEDIAITIENDTLTIAADYGRITREEREGYLIRERRGGRIERSFTLEGIDQNAITATAADGILTITLPKEAPAEGKGPRRIAITGSAGAVSGGVPAIEAPAE